MAKHTFKGQVSNIHAEKSPRAFVLVNDGDYFGATVWLTKAQVEKLVPGDLIKVEGNVRIDKSNEGNYDMASIKVARGEKQLISVAKDGKWLDISVEPTPVGTTESTAYPKD